MLLNNARKFMNELNYEAAAVATHRCRCMNCLNRYRSAYVCCVPIYPRQCISVCVCVPCVEFNRICRIVAFRRTLYAACTHHITYGKNGRATYCAWMTTQSFCTTFCDYCESIIDWQKLHHSVEHRM